MKEKLHHRHILSKPGKSWAVWPQSWCLTSLTFKFLYIKLYSSDGNAQGLTSLAAIASSLWVRKGNGGLAGSLQEPLRPWFITNTPTTHLHHQAGPPESPKQCLLGILTMCGGTPLKREQRNIRADSVRGSLAKVY